MAAFGTACKSGNGHGAGGGEGGFHLGNYNPAK